MALLKVLDARQDLSDQLGRCHGYTFNVQNI